MSVEGAAGLAEYPSADCLAWSGECVPWPVTVECVVIDAESSDYATEVDDPVPVS